MKFNGLLLAFFLLFGCAVEQDTLPECSVFYAVSAKDGMSHTFTVRYLDPFGVTHEKTVSGKSWSSPTYNDGFERGDYVEIQVTVPQQGPVLEATIYKNFYVLEDVRLSANQSTVLLGTTLP